MTVMPNCAKKKDGNYSSKTSHGRGKWITFLDST